MKRLQKRERAFCRLFALTGDGEYAARAAGYKHPRESFVALTEREEIAEGVTRAAQAYRGMMRASSAAGLWRLAFGNPSDAVSLCFDDTGARERLYDLDLFNVSEIKAMERGIEIRFFDRIKALEKLHEMLGDDHADAPSGLIEALTQGARSLAQGDDDAV